MRDRGESFESYRARGGMLDFEAWVTQAALGDAGGLEVAPQVDEQRVPAPAAQRDRVYEPEVVGLRLGGASTGPVVPAVDVPVVTGPMLGPGSDRMPGPWDDLPRPELSAEERADLAELDRRIKAAAQRWTLEGAVRPRAKSTAAPAPRIEPVAPREPAQACKPQVDTGTSSHDEPGQVYECRPVPVEAVPVTEPDAVTLARRRILAQEIAALRAKAAHRRSIRGTIAGLFRSLARKLDG
jgi:hypothetical protein